MKKKVFIFIIIIIFAIFLIPQFLKYVKNSKISTDIQSARSLYTILNVGIIDGIVNSENGFGKGVNTLPMGLSITSFPKSKVNSSWSWSYDIGKKGVERIYLNDVEIYPNSDIYKNYCFKQGKEI